MLTSTTKYSVYIRWRLDACIKEKQPPCDDRDQGNDTAEADALGVVRSQEPNRTKSWRVVASAFAKSSTAPTPSTATRQRMLFIGERGAAAGGAAAGTCFHPFPKKAG